MENGPFNKLEKANPFPANLKNAIDELRAEYKINPLHEQIFTKYLNDVENSGAKQETITKEYIKEYLLSKLIEAGVTKIEEGLTEDDIKAAHADIDNSLNNLKLKDLENMDKEYDIDFMIREVGIVDKSKADEAKQKIYGFIAKNPDKDAVKEEFHNWFRSQFQEAALNIQY